MVERRRHVKTSPNRGIFFSIGEILGPFWRTLQYRLCATLARRGLRLRLPPSNRRGATLSRRGLCLRLPPPSAIRPPPSAIRPPRSPPPALAIQSPRCYFRPLRSLPPAPRRPISAVLPYPAAVPASGPPPPPSVIRPPPRRRMFKVEGFAFRKL